ncbi:uncharacterized protein LOC141646679 [Silene latifolia]|uniref:uncharacterized protein LOC141646679 n=1 Tax=Silene latifolia TaxID=37657 RepID=UPI003D7775B1
MHINPKSEIIHKYNQVFEPRKSRKMDGVQMVLAKEYGYVVLVLVLYCFLNFWMMYRVGKARKKYKVYYPTLYAVESENKDANLFNCVQRGHQNSLEYMPVFFILLILGGIKHPSISAGLGFAYIVTRFFYFTGYSSGEPQKRLSIGKYGFVALSGLLFCTISFGIHLIIT